MKRVIRKPSMWLMVVLACAAILSIATLAQRAITESAEVRDAEISRSETFRLIAASNRISIDLLDAMRGFRGYLITGDEHYLAPYRSGRSRLTADLTAVEKLSSSTQLAHSPARLRQAALDALRVFDTGVRLTSHGRREEAVALIKSGTGERALVEVSRITSQLEVRALEAGRVQNEAANRDTREARAAAMSLGLVASLLVMLVFAAGALALRDRRRESDVLRNEIERLEAMFEEAPVFIAIGTAPDFKFEYANRAYRQLVGRSELVGRNVSDALPEVVDQGFVDLLHRVTESGEAISRRQARLVLHPPGADADIQAYVDFVYQPLKDRTGRVTRIMCVGYDVTREHQIRSEAQSLAAEVEAARKAGVLGSLASSIAHELNQPLGAASNYLAAAIYMLRAPGFRPEEAEGLLEGATQQVVRAGEIIRGLMSLAGRRPPRRAPTDLKRVIADAIETVQASGSCPYKVQRRLPRTKVLVNADSVQLEEVLTNLIRNGAQAVAGKSDLPLMITLKRSADAAVVEVLDCGPGFDPRQLEGTLTIGESTTGGLGLGLAVSRTIIEAHGGRFDIRNRSEGGAAVTLTLPLAEDLHAEASLGSNVSHNLPNV